MTQSSHPLKQKTAWCVNKVPICHCFPRRFFGARTCYIVLKVHNYEDELCFERKFCNSFRLTAMCISMSGVISLSPRLSLQNFQFVWQLQALASSASHPIWDSFHETSLTPKPSSTLRLLLLARDLILPNHPSFPNSGQKSFSILFYHNLLTAFNLSLLKC